MVNYTKMIEVCVCAFLISLCHVRIHTNVIGMSASARNASHPYTHKHTYSLNALRISMTSVQKLTFKWLKIKINQKFSILIAHSPFLHFTGFKQIQLNCDFLATAADCSLLTSSGFAPGNRVTIVVNTHTHSRTVA